MAFEDEAIILSFESEGVDETAADFGLLAPILDVLETRLQEARIHLRRYTASLQESARGHRASAGAVSTHAAQLERLNRAQEKKVQSSLPRPPKPPTVSTRPPSVAPAPLGDVAPQRPRVVQDSADAVIAPARAPERPGVPTPPGDMAHPTPPRVVRDRADATAAPARAPTIPPEPAIMRAPERFTVPFTQTREMGATRELPSPAQAPTILPVITGATAQLAPPPGRQPHGPDVYARSGGSAADPKLLGALERVNVSLTRLDYTLRHNVQFGARGAGQAQQAKAPASPRTPKPAQIPKPPVMPSGPAVNLNRAYAQLQNAVKSGDRARIFDAQFKFQQAQTRFQRAQNAGRPKTQQDIWRDIINTSRVAFGPNGQLQLMPLVNRLSQSGGQFAMNKILNLAQNAAPSVAANTAGMAASAAEATTALDALGMAVNPVTAGFAVIAAGFVAGAASFKVAMDRIGDFTDVYYAGQGTRKETAEAISIGRGMGKSPAQVASEIDALSSALAQHPGVAYQMNQQTGSKINPFTNPFQTDNIDKTKNYVEFVKGIVNAPSEDVARKDAAKLGFGQEYLKLRLLTPENKQALFSDLQKQYSPRAQAEQVNISFEYNRVMNEFSQKMENFGIKVMPMVNSALDWTTQHFETLWKTLTYATSPIQALGDAIDWLVNRISSLLGFEPPEGPASKRGPASVASGGAAAASIGAAAASQGQLAPSNAAPQIANRERAPQAAGVGSGNVNRGADAGIGGNARPQGITQRPPQVGGVASNVNRGPAEAGVVGDQKGAAAISAQTRMHMALDRNTEALNRLSHLQGVNNQILYGMYGASRTARSAVPSGWGPQNFDEQLRGQTVAMGGMVLA